MKLPRPCRYFPLAHGKYEVVAGLRPLGTDFGNGAADGNVFQFDTQFAHYRAAKLRSRAEMLERYVPQTVRLSDELRQAVARFIAETLAQEHAGLFELRGRSLRCALTGEMLVFDAQWNRVDSAGAQPPYHDAFDALASQLQEDLAVWSRDPLQPADEWLAAVHLCFPNHWAAEDKIGRSFNAVHAPVAGFERLTRAAPALVDGMIKKGPFVRFAWGVATDCELNHHPRAAPTGRSFDPRVPELYVRVERQTLTPFAHEQGSLFTIRTYFLNVATELTGAERIALRSAILSMPPESLAYKGLVETRESIIRWLDGFQDGHAKV